MIYDNGKRLISQFFIICITAATFDTPALVSGPFLPDLFIVFISIIYLFFFFNSMKEFKLFKNIFFRLFILFYLYLVLTSLLSDHFNESIRSSITYIRFGLFSLAVYLLKNNNKLIKYFYLVVYFTIIVLLIDGYYQFFTGKNIFGYKVIRPDRLGGLFF